MAESSKTTRLALAAGRFVLTFLGCLIVLPIVGLLLLFPLAPFGLEGIAGVLIVFPGYMLWLGNLHFYHGSGTTIYGSEGYHYIPALVWPITWIIFALAAENERWDSEKQFTVAFWTIVVVTAGMNLVMLMCGIQLFLELP